MTAAITKLTHLGALLVSGPDARQFLQGQLTADVSSLTSERILLAACNSPQGRVQAVLWLIERPEGIVLLVARELLETTATRLRRYILRAKVTVDTSALRVGLLDDATSGDPGVDRTHRLEGSTSLLRWSGHRHALVVTPDDITAEDADRELRWRAEHLRAGLPQVYSATHERFVAQMLNLDLLGGISFTKGCYTGQEIIARAHYRGTVKRRMFHFRAPCAAPAPGTLVTAGDQHAGDVVDAIATASGCELLAVINLAQLDERLRLEGIDDSALERLPLPYDVGAPQS